MITVTVKIFHNGLLLPDEEEQRDSREEGRSSLRVSVSSAGNTTQWRKESVTIVERAEDEKAAEDEPDKPDKPDQQDCQTF